ncbi:MAG: winged helix-turn-helix domain-containing protein [Pseudomonadota bacterium]
MIYEFGAFTLDSDKVELKRSGLVIATEPQVFRLLLLLLENSERLVTKDEIIGVVWAGRIVSDSAISSRIKSARQILGDSGAEQHFIRTVHGQGFRFVGNVSRVTPSHAPKIELPLQLHDPIPPKTKGRGETTKPSIAVLPFHVLGEAGPYASIADALPHDLISALARLRWLFVIARGSSFRFRAPDPDMAEVGALLKVRYCLTGMVEVFGNAIVITVELTDTRDGGVLWADRFKATIDDVHDIRSQIISSVVAALELQIPLNEARIARLATPECLDAWSSYHLGLQHLLRFTEADNGIAELLFARAIHEDPSFSRAHAGLSSTFFQNAFMNYTNDPTSEILRAKDAAMAAVQLDPMDPFSNFAMGRTFWLEGDLDGSRAWLDRATSISPNYAQGIYAQAWTDTIAGHGHEGLASAELAMSLSPLDPFLYAMLGTRALAYLAQGQDAEAAEWAERAARSPGAHVLIALIAVAAHCLNGDDSAAKAWADSARARRPDVSREHFFRSFPFRDQTLRGRIDKALASFGI